MPTIARLRDVPRAGTQLRILVLGGTSFLGVHQVNYALARGHRWEGRGREGRGPRPSTPTGVGTGGPLPSPLSPLPSRNGSLT